MWEILHEKISRRVHRVTIMGRRTRRRRWRYSGNNEDIRCSGVYRCHAPTMPASDKESNVKHHQNAFYGEVGGNFWIPLIHVEGGPSRSGGMTVFASGVADWLMARKTASRRATD